MRLSVWPSLRQPWSDVLDAAGHTDLTGWHRLYVADHFMGDGVGNPADGPNLEATAVIGALAVATTRIGLGTLVLGNTYRHPAVLANWAASISVISGGRYVLGIGAGWQENEHEQYGITLPPPGERVRRFDEACQVIRSLLREPTTTLHGEHYQLTDALCEPKPAPGELPLLIGGRQNRMLQLVARRADEWNIWADPEQFRDRWAVLQRHCEDIGRDPGTLHRSAQAMVLVTDDPGKAERFRERIAPRAAFAGTPEQFAEFLRELEEAGVQEFIVPDFALGTGSARRETLDALLGANPS